MTMRTLLTCAALAALLGFSAPTRARAEDGPAAEEPTATSEQASCAPAKDDSLEVMCGDKSCAVDFKASGKVETALGDIGIFTRHIPTIDYRKPAEEQVGYFGLVDATYPIWGGIDAVAEAQFIPGVGLKPRAGLQFFGSWGDFSVYALATAGLTERYHGEAIVVPRYQTGITDRLDLAASVECLTDFKTETDFSGADHLFSAQKFRAGVVIDDTAEVGAAVDLSETGSAGLDDPNYGGYLKVSF